MNCTTTSPTPVSELFDYVCEDIGRALSAQSWLYHLFGTDASMEVLKGAVPEFWGVVKAALITDLLVTLGRLLDLEIGMGRPNVSVRGIVAALPNADVWQLRLTSMEQELESEIEELKNIRHRRVAHNDQESVLQDLGSFDPGSVDRVLEKLAEHMDEIADSMGKTRFMWRHYREQRIDGLMRILQLGQQDGRIS